MSRTGKVLIHSGIGLASALIGLIIGLWMGWMLVLFQVG